MSEAMFLTQGFLYPNAEAAEARFKGEDPGFIYSRVMPTRPPTCSKNACARWSAEEAVRHIGMAAVAAAILCQVQRRAIM